VLVGAIWMLRYLYEQKKVERIAYQAICQVALDDLLHQISTENMQNSLEKTADLREKSLEKVEEVDDATD
jgi:hypothetical protein